jgi:nucleoside-diphosphate-sugar epimerase
MTTLVTGAGLVGSHLVQQLQQAGELPVLLDVDIDEGRLARTADPERVILTHGHLGDLPSLLRLIRQHGITRIVHTAALTAISWSNPYRGFSENALGTLNVLEAASLENVEKVVFSSSSSVYGAAGAGRTDPLDESVTPVPTDVYGIAKLTGELLGTVYGRDRGFQFSAVRYPLVVPPVDPGFQSIPHTSVTRVGTAIGNMVLAAARGERYVTTDWHPLEWIYAPDAATGTCRALATDAPCGVFNLTAGPLTLAELADAIRAQVPEADIEVRPATGGSVMRRVIAADAGQTVREPLLDAGRAHRDLGFAPAYGLTDMVATMLASARARPA